MLNFDLHPEVATGVTFTYEELPAAVPASVGGTGTDSLYLTRRQFIKRAAFVGAGLVLAGCLPSITPEMSAYSSESVTPILSGELIYNIGEEGVQTITDTLERYVNLLGSPISAVYFNDVQYPTEISQEGIEIVTLGNAIPGHIYLNSKEITKGAVGIPVVTQLKELTLHLLTQALQRGETSLLSGLLLSDSSELIGIQGLTLLVKTRTGENTAFRLIEKGVAEALASFVDPTYHIPQELGLLQTGLLSIELINSLSNPQQVAKMVQNNDLGGFVKMILGKEEVNLIDVETVMGWYQRANNGEDLQTLLNLIALNRKRNLSNING